MKEALVFFGGLVEQLLQEGSRPHGPDLVCWIPRGGNKLADASTHVAAPGCPERWLHRSAGMFGSVEDLIAVSDAGMHERDGVRVATQGRAVLTRKGGRVLAFWASCRPLMEDEECNINLEELTVVTTSAAIVTILRRGRGATEGLREAWRHTGDRLCTASARRRLRTKGLLDVWMDAAETENRADSAFAEGAGEDETLQCFSHERTWNQAEIR